MVRSTVEEEADLTKRENETLELVITAIEETKPFNDRSGRSFTLLRWDFSITTPEFAGQSIGGTTASKLTTHSNNQYRNWVETVLGMELAPGQGIDTDDLIGLPCQGIIGVRKWGDPERVEANIKALLPPGATLPDEPPF